MARYGFVIDNRRCIGCHACSTACKAENAVPVGVNRTWVKYVEKGTFPHTRRYFQVTRCNHCEDPPCVRICPVGAMQERADGIVDFDAARCIGCKACMQACPYEAIHIDPERGTAAKCHFCAHRIESGLAPACVTVCPTQAIAAGDLDDPASAVARLVAANRVRVRRPDQGTRPKLFYVEAEEAAIVPGAAGADGGHLWSRPPREASLPGAGWRPPALAAPGASGRETYAPPQRVPWGWQVPAYLVTKAIGGGAFAVGAGGVALGWLPAEPRYTVGAAAIGVVFTLLTLAVLVSELERPERFWMLLARAQWRSWVARGGVILGAFLVLAVLYGLVALAGDGPPPAWLAVPGALLGLAAAGYSGFLLAQAEGRDLWQSTALPAHLVVQALACGAASFTLLLPIVPGTGGARGTLLALLAASLALDLLLTLGEVGVLHASSAARVASRLITCGRYRGLYRLRLYAGLGVPIALALAGAALTAELAALAGALAIAGLAAWEWAYIMAPQQVPNS